VNETIDLIGASGATYRFRLVTDPNQLPSTAGNFAYVRWRGSAVQVMGCGAVNSLQEAARDWNVAVRDHGAQGSLCPPERGAFYERRRTSGPG